MGLFYFDLCHNGETAPISVIFITFITLPHHGHIAISVSKKCTISQSCTLKMKGNEIHKFKDLLYYMWSRKGRKGANLEAVWPLAGLGGNIWLLQPNTPDFQPLINAQTPICGQMQLTRAHLGRALPWDSAPNVSTHLQISAHIWISNRQANKNSQGEKDEVAISALFTGCGGFYLRLKGGSTPCCWGQVSIDHWRQHCSYFVYNHRTHTWTGWSRNNMHL